MLIENHKRNLEESLEEIDEAIEKGIENRQRTIGFHTSAACVDMFEILLHEKNLISSGFMVKHEWFLSKHKTNDKFSFDFDRKDEIIKLIKSVEEKRNILCYGKKQNLSVIQEVIDKFNELKKIMIELGVIGEEE